MTADRHPAPPDLAPFAIGDRVLAGGTPGTVESIAWSVATETLLYVVAHDSRMRLTYRAREIRPATEGATR